MLLSFCFAIYNICEIKPIIYHEVSQHSLKYIEVYNNNSNCNFNYISKNHFLGVFLVASKLLVRCKVNKFAYHTSNIILPLHRAKALQIISDQKYIVSNKKPLFQCEQKSGFLFEFKVKLKFLKKQSIFILYCFLMVMETQQ